MATTNKRINTMNSATMVDPYGIGVNSHNRIEVLLSNREHMPLEEWIVQLGECWSCCDAIGAYWTDVHEALVSMSRQELDMMMNAEELRFHRALPSRFKVWRGCYEFNAHGLSWSLSREIAAGFTNLIRYHHKSFKPMLLEAWVSRDDIVVKLDRGEQEIIAFMIEDALEVAH